MKMLAASALWASLAPLEVLPAQLVLLQFYVKLYGYNPELVEFFLALLPFLPIDFSSLQRLPEIRK